MAKWGKLVKDMGVKVESGRGAAMRLARTPPVWMKVGDSIEIEIERMGVLGNRVV